MTMIAFKFNFINKKENSTLFKKWIMIVTKFLCVCVCSEGNAYI